MRELGMMEVNGSINESFSEIRELSGACRFKDCTHTVETGCAVLRAVEDGSLDEDRYRGYLKLLKESRFYSMSYVERRSKDKQFGRMVNTALKQLRKRKPSV
jgi:ribosome biogenesis GTPase